MSINIIPTRGIPFQLTRVSLRAILPDEEKQWKELMDEHHPLGDAQFSGHQVKYVAEHCGQAVALLCFSSSAYWLADRDRWIGWSGDQRTCRRHFVVQNSRFLILKKDKRKNLASRVLSLCAKQVPLDWEKRFGFAPLLLETFVDPIHFRGTCYQAANWIQIGKTRGFRRDRREFYSSDSTPKSIWVKPLRPGACELLRSGELPPKLRKFEKALPKKELATKIGVKGLDSLFRRLQRITDTRKGQGKLHPIGACLSIVACAVLAGCEGLRECAEFAADLPQKQLEALRVWRNPKTGKYVAPAHTTLWRVVSSVDAEEFESEINSWLTDTAPFPEAIAIDGKVLRATMQNEEGGICAISAVSHSSSPLFSNRQLSHQKDRKYLEPKS